MAYKLAQASATMSALSAFQLADRLDRPGYPQSPLLTPPRTRSIWNGHRMGIRYYAYPVEPELVDKARADPETFISADPLMDAWGPTHERPTMLYLDKWQMAREGKAIIYMIG